MAVKPVLDLQCRQVLEDERTPRKPILQLSFLCLQISHFAWLSLSHFYSVLLNLIFLLSFLFFNWPISPSPVLPLPMMLPLVGLPPFKMDPFPAPFIQKLSSVTFFIIGLLLPRKSSLVKCLCTPTAIRGPGTEVEKVGKSSRQLHRLSNLTLYAVSKCFSFFYYFLHMDFLLLQDDSRQE